MARGLKRRRRLLLECGQKRSRGEGRKEREV